MRPRTAGYFCCLTPYDVLGVVAGTLVAVSTIPKVLDRIAAARARTAAFNLADLRRDSLQMAGNGVWVIVGLLTGLKSIVLFAACRRCCWPR